MVSLLLGQMSLLLDTLVGINVSIEGNEKEDEKRVQIGSESKGENSYGENAHVEYRIQGI